jgi:TPR repeat protein
VTPLPPRPTGVSANTPEFSSEPASDPGNLRSSRSGKQASLVTRLCVIAVAITATAGAGTGLYLYTRSAPENFTSATASAGGASARIIEATGSKPGEPSGPSPDQQIVGDTASSASPTANALPSDMAAIVVSPPEGISSGPTQRFVAPPAQAASNREERSLEPPPVASMSVARTASEVAAPETNTTVATSAPVIPSADVALSAAEIAVLLTRGDASLSSGDVASARLYYGRAANAGDGQAALRLGETYDPVFLDHAHLRSVRGDVAVALSWYQRARALGAAEAEVLLNSLEAK